MHSSGMRTVRCSGRLRGGGCLPRGCLPRGVSAHFNLCPRGCLPRGGVCPGKSVQGCLPGGGGGGLPRGCLPRRGVRPPVDRQTQACENIPFPQVLLRTVITI